MWSDIQTRRDVDIILSGFCQVRKRQVENSIKTSFDRASLRTGTLARNHETLLDLKMIIIIIIMKRVGLSVILTRKNSQFVYLPYNISIKPVQFCAIKSNISKFLNNMDFF